MQKLPKLPFTVGPRTRKVLRIVGYIVFAIVSFVFALQLTFPYDRVRQRIEEELGKKYDVSIASVERGFMPGRMTLKTIVLKTRPAAKDIAKAEEIEDPKERQKALAMLVTTFVIESLEVDVNLLPLIGGKASVDIEAHVGSGELAGNITIWKGGTAVDLTGDSLPGERLPMRELIGLPLSGNLDFSVALELPNERTKAGKVATNWKHAEGLIVFQCKAGCVIGDGKTKLKMKVKKQSQEAFQGDGVKFGKVNIASLLARVEIGKGNLELTKFETKSEDGELHVDYQMTLDQTLDESTVNGCLRFAGSETLRKREPDTHSAFLATGALRGPDNLFHIKLTGLFKDMKRLPLSCGPGVNGTAPDELNGGGKTPQLKVQPSEDMKPPTPPTEGAAVNPPPPETVTPPIDAGVPSDGATPATKEGAPPVEGEPGTGSGSAINIDPAANPAPPGEGRPPVPAVEPQLQ